MGLLKDWKEDNAGYRFQTQVTHFFDPREWLRLQKWRTQRANRGWSDRDTWGAGDHIARMTAEMLTRLRDKTYVDWEHWFEYNVKEEGKNVYKNLTEIIDDITAYLDFTETSWADGLTTRRDSVDEIFTPRSDGMYEYVGPDWYEGEKKLSEAAIKNRINKHFKQEQKLYKKAQKAMSFFARHFSSFWD